MEYTDKILKVAETIVAGMKSLKNRAVMGATQGSPLATPAPTGSQLAPAPAPAGSQLARVPAPAGSQLTPTPAGSQLARVPAPAGSQLTPTPAGSQLARVPAPAGSQLARMPAPAPASVPTPSIIKSQAEELRRIKAAKDPREILELKPGATPAEIKEARGRKLLIAHPNKGGDSESFEKVNEAYKTLMSIKGGRRTANRRLNRRSRRRTTYRR